jgi:hypothetical protein
MKQIPWRSTQIVNEDFSLVADSQLSETWLLLHYGDLGGEAVPPGTKPALPS